MHVRSLTPAPAVRATVRWTPLVSRHNATSSTDFNGETLAGGDFSEKSLVDADFSNATLTGATFAANLTNANFTGADLSGADLSGAILSAQTSKARP